ncbi:MAG: GNAT family N-acetyltransferase [Hyphomicrobiaceae bacterium]
MNADIKQITEDDIEGYHHVLDVVGREQRYISFLKAPPIEQTRSFVMHNIANDVPQFIAKTEGMIVGWCDVCPKGQAIYAHSAILGMGVLPNHRKKGIGNALIDAALNKAFQRNIVRVELAVFSDNVEAVQLYKKFGFRVEGELQDDAVIDGQYKNSLIMALICR